MNVGPFSGATGILNVNGGNTYVSSSMRLGAGNCAANGFVYMNGGQLSVTNSGLATLEILSGSISLAGGTLLVDKIGHHQFLRAFCEDRRHSRLQQPGLERER